MKVEKFVESKKNVGKICTFLDIGCYIIIVIIIQIVVDLFIYNTTWAYITLLCRQTVDVFAYNYDDTDHEDLPSKEKERLVNLSIRLHK